MSDGANLGSVISREIKISQMSGLFNSANPVGLKNSIHIACNTDDNSKTSSFQLNGLGVDLTLGTVDSTTGFRVKKIRMVRVYLE